MPDYSAMATCTNCPENEGSMSQTNRDYDANADDDGLASIEREFRCSECGEEATATIDSDGMTCEGCIIFDYEVDTMED